MADVFDDSKFCYVSLESRHVDFPILLKSKAMKRKFNLNQDTDPGALTNSQASSSPPSTGALLLVVPVTSPQPAPTLWSRGSRRAAWSSRCTGCGTSPPPTQSAETIAALQRGLKLSQIVVPIVLFLTC